MNDGSAHEPDRRPSPLSSSRGILQMSSGNVVSAADVTPESIRDSILRAAAAVRADYGRRR